MRRIVLASLLGSLLALALVLSGCTRPGPTWVDENASYSADEARALLDSTGIGALSGTPTSDAGPLRRSALAALRNRGESASTAATLVTRVFPPDVKAVPVYVELATVDDRQALILIEAWGSQNDNLSLKRLWIVDARTGDVIESAAGR